MPGTLVFGAQPTYTVGQTSPSEFQGIAVTPADGTDLSTVGCQGIYVTGAGNVNVDLQSGGTAVLTTIGAGQTVRINVKRIRSTSTTATGIYALYPSSTL